MRKHFVALLGAAALTAVPLGLTATASASSGPQQNSVTGEAKFGGLGAQVRIDAHGDPVTGAADGHFYLSQGALDISGTVTCLQVVNNEAVAGGIVTDSSDPTVVGQGFLQYVEDNGSPGTNDLSYTAYRVPLPGQTCPTPTGGGFQLTQGNYVVMQAQS